MKENLLDQGKRSSGDLLPKTMEGRELERGGQGLAGGLSEGQAGGSVVRVSSASSTIDMTSPLLLSLAHELA